MEVNNEIEEIKKSLENILELNKKNVQLSDDEKLELSVELFRKILTGWHVAAVEKVDKIDFNGYDVIVNTSPKLSDVNFKSHKYGAIYIDLAGKDVLPLAELSASGIDAKYYPAMPAKFYPKSAGKLICDFIFRKCFSFFIFIK